MSKRTYDSLAAIKADQTFPGNAFPDNLQIPYKDGSGAIVGSTNVDTIAQSGVTHVLVKNGVSGAPFWIQIAAINTANKATLKIGA